MAPGGRRTWRIVSWVMTRRKGRGGVRGSGRGVLIRLSTTTKRGWEFACKVPVRQICGTYVIGTPNYSVSFFFGRFYLACLIFPGGSTATVFIFDTAVDEKSSEDMLDRVVRFPARLA